QRWRPTARGSRRSCAPRRRPGRGKFPGMPVHSLGPGAARAAGENAPAPGGAPGTATIARRLVGGLLGAAETGVPTLAAVRGAPGRRLALTEVGRSYVVGRGGACALPLDVEEVSREHAAFMREASSVVVRDLGSKNGVLVAGARIQGERRLAD